MPLRSNKLQYTLTTIAVVYFQEMLFHKLNSVVPYCGPSTVFSFIFSANASKQHWVKAQTALLLGHVVSCSFNEEKLTIRNKNSRCLLQFILFVQVCLLICKLFRVLVITKQIFRNYNAVQLHKLELLESIPKYIGQKYFHTLHEKQKSIVNLKKLTTKLKSFLTNLSFYGLPINLTTTLSSYQE